MSGQSHFSGGQVLFIITLAASTFLMGSSFVAGKILIHAGFPPMILVGWRFLVAAVATPPFVRVGKGRILSALFPAGAAMREVGWVVLIGLSQTTAVMGLLFWAIQSIAALTAAILLFTNPIWVALMGRVFLGEDLRRGRMAGLVLGVIGVSFAVDLGINSSTDGKSLVGK